MNGSYISGGLQVYRLCQNEEHGKPHQDRSNKDHAAMSAGLLNRPDSKFWKDIGKAFGK